MEVIHTSLGLSCFYIYYQGFAIISGQKNCSEYLSWTDALFDFFWIPHRNSEKGKNSVDWNPYRNLLRTCRLWRRDWICLGVLESQRLVCCCYLMLEGLLRWSSSIFLVIDGETEPRETKNLPEGTYGFVRTISAIQVFWFLGQFSLLHRVLPSESRRSFD